MKRGSLRAQGALGAICLIRCNTNLSLKNRGTQLLIKSTQRGDPFAMMNFGSIYKIGGGIFADLTLARTWHLRAIEFGKSKLVPMMADMTAYDDSIGKARQVDFTAADEKGKEVSTSLDRLGEILGVFHEAYNGKIKAIVELGRIFQQGTEVPQDTVCAEKLFQIAADRGELFALCYLGKPGIVRLQKLSLEGNLVATFSLALAFARGIGCEKNENEATRLLLQLLSHCKLLLLGYWSSKSTPSKVKKEIVMIKDLLKKEMDEGRLLQNDLPDQLMNVVNNMMLAFEDQPHAIHLLGVEFETGESVPKDIVFAVKLYEKAAELKDSHAMIHLASLYENGQGVPQDISKAISYLNNACDLNNASAMNILGNMYEFGAGVKVDEALAAKLYLRAVALSSPEGMTNLGVLYAEGRGVLKDFKKAKMLLEEAVKRKDPQAMYSLAMLLLREGDVAKASRYILDLLKDSASLENPAAMYQLGCLYREGKIVEKDEDQASEYFAHAASLGRADASQKLCELYTQVDEN
jgi:TPR repeat protein